MTAVFAPVAQSLREAVLDWYDHSGQALEGAAGSNTLATNSSLVERRSVPLIEMLRQCGVPSVAGLDVVDLGCGFGAMSTYFAARGARVTGIDPHETRLEVGRRVTDRHDLPARFAQGWMQHLDELPTAGFDVAIQNNSLCYVVDRGDRASALRETLRVLRPGGWLVVRNPNRWSPVDQFTGLPLLAPLPPAIANRVAGALRRDRSRVRLASPLEAVRELRSAGFTQVVLRGFVEGGRPDLLRFVARYQHLTARRPPT